MTIAPDEGIPDSWKIPEYIDPGPMEKDYMRSVAAPVMTITYGETQRNTLVLNETLKAHEICLYELRPRQNAGDP